MFLEKRDIYIRTILENVNLMVNKAKIFYYFLW